MSKDSLLVTLTVEQLRQIVRDEVRAIVDNSAARVTTAPAVLTSDEAAAFLKMPVGVLRKRAAKGEVPSFKIGAVLRFRVSELEGWIAELQKKAG